MYNGIYKGVAAAAQRKRILILGESHHDLESLKTTKIVMEEYLGGAYSSMFQKIAQAFGVDTGKGRDAERAFLWDRVYFGNYIDISLDGPSGEGDHTAKKLIAAHNERYNQDLAEIIKTYGIDIVFCFSDRVFDALPNEEGHWSWTLFQDVKHGKDDLWFGRGYGPDSPLGRELNVYGVPHPQYWYRVGIKPEELVQYIRPIFEDCCGG